PLRMIFLTPKRSAVREIDPTLWVERMLGAIKAISFMFSYYNTIKCLSFLLLLVVMDEDRNQAKAREQEEQSTKQRAAILGLAYLDTREYEESLPLIETVIDVPDMHKNRIIPLIKGNDAE